MTEFISPVGRFVQGSMSLETKMDPQTGKPKLDDQGQPIKENFIALAIRKDDPDFPKFYGLMHATARAEFPHLFDAAGNCTHPQFAWKLQDGDGVDTSGKSVADKPGFAGHWIIKMATRYLPKCFHHGKYDPAQQIQNPNEVIKRGYYIRIAGTMRGNGVSPQDRTQKPGLFISPNLVELVAFGEEIQSGPDASKVFGGAAPIASLPPGASTTPRVPAPAPGGATPPPVPTAPGVPVPAPAAPAAPMPAAPMPAMPAAPMPAAPMPAASPTVPLPPAPGGVAWTFPPAPAPAATGPAYVMTAAAQGATREALLANGWTDATLLQHGMMVPG